MAVRSHHMGTPEESLVCETLFIYFPYALAVGLLKPSP